MINLIQNKNLFDILGNMEKLKINKAWVLNNIQKFDLIEKNKYGASALMYIICNNENKKIRFTKNEIMGILDFFDLTQQDDCGKNALMHLIIFNSIEKLGFNKFDIIKIIDKFDCTQEDYCGMNVLFHIINYNQCENLGFNEQDVLGIAKKFDLLKINVNNYSIYDLIVENRKYISLFSGNNMSLLLSIIDINMKDKYGDNILIRELKNGLIINNKDLIKKIMETDNKEIINCVYECIDQILWEQKELLKFLNKNRLHLTKNICGLLVVSQFEIK